MPSMQSLGLCDNRPKRVIFQDDPEALQKQPEVDQENDMNTKLDDKSRQITDEINTRFWAAKYLQYLTKRIRNDDRVHVELSDMPDLQGLSLESNKNSSVPWDTFARETSLSIQLQVVERRRLDACIGTEETWDALNTLISVLTSGISDHPQDDDIAFRAFHDGSKAQLFGMRGDIRCGNWKEFELGQTLKRVEAERHVEGSTKAQTNYISISTSPLRLWNYIKNEWDFTLKIAVIDLRVLERLGIAYGSTTDDLGLQGTNNGPGNRTEFATKHHHLVVGWLPRQSILGFLSKSQFSLLLQESSLGSCPGEYDEKIPFERIKTAICVKKGDRYWRTPK